MFSHCLSVSRSPSTLALIWVYKDFGSVRAFPLTSFTNILWSSLLGQVVALFIVGFSEYAVVWLGTDWEKEVQKGIERNKEEASRRRLHSRIDLDE